MDWIMTKDKLPENENMVIIHGGIGYFNRGNNTWYTLTGTSWPREIQWEVKFWMPLPEPPKE